MLHKTDQEFEHPLTYFYKTDLGPCLNLPESFWALFVLFEVQLDNKGYYLVLTLLWLYTVCKFAASNHCP